eukprot:m.762684 g.762684  ORF g.762684 m.762684 type:complete len:132 (-) comp23211_c0_seq5:1107-1502(-)
MTGTETLTTAPPQHCRSTSGATSAAEGGEPSILADEHPAVLATALIAPAVVCHHLHVRGATGFCRCCVAKTLHARIFTAATTQDRAQGGSVVTMVVSARVLSNVMGATSNSPATLEIRAASVQDTCLVLDR